MEPEPSSSKSWKFECRRIGNNRDRSENGHSNGTEELEINGQKFPDGRSNKASNGQKFPDGNVSSISDSQESSDKDEQMMTNDQSMVEEIPYTVRRMKEYEIPLVLKMCKREGRQMGLSHELLSWFRFDPLGFYVAVHPDSGEILGSCAGIRLSSSHGNIGMFVVREDLRGKGIGKNIWNHVMMHLNNFNPSSSPSSSPTPRALPSQSSSQAYKSSSSSSQPCSSNANLNQLQLSSPLPMSPIVPRTRLRYNLNSNKKRNIGLSALNSLLPMYRDKCGFNHVSDFSVHLYALEMNKLDSNGLFIPSISSTSSSLSSSGLKVVPFTPRLIYALLSFDAALHAYDRRKILKFLLSEPEVMFRVAFRGGKIAGYGAIKPSLQENCWMIAPLYASDSVVAKELLLELIRSLYLNLIFEENNVKSSVINGIIESGNEKIVLKIPSNNLDGITMIESLSFERMDNYCSWRCYTENHFLIQSRKIFAFHSTVFCSE